MDTGNLPAVLQNEVAIELEACQREQTPEKVHGAYTFPNHLRELPVWKWSWQLLVELDQVVAALDKYTDDFREGHFRTWKQKSDARYAKQALASLEEDNGRRTSLWNSTDGHRDSTRAAHWACYGACARSDAGGRLD